jgi:hypothetical protein
MISVGTLPEVMFALMFYQGIIIVITLVLTIVSEILNDKK